MACEFEGSAAPLSETGHGKGKGKGKGKGPPPPPPAPRAEARRTAEAAREEGPVLKLRVRGEGEALNSAPFTVVTNTDGSRVVQQPDGTATKVGRFWRQEDGLPDAHDAEVRDDGSESAEGTAKAMAESLESLTQKEPRLAEYAALHKSGVPLKVLKARITGELGRGLAEAFLAAVMVGGQSRLLRTVPPAAHGRLGSKDWPAPILAVACADIARPGYDSGAAHEYLDSEEVLVQKVRILADLVRKAQKFVIYAGAGLSTASGISDYATRTGSQGIVGQQGGAKAPMPLSPYSAKPNLGHRVVAAMGRAGLVWRFVQQNHDGLPQKAGFPQHLMNEIHGAWFDPSNPVVPMSGSLRDDLFKDLLACEREADLVLAIGSSLCGMNSDRLVSTCAGRARRSTPIDPALGSVIVSLQRTPHDEDSSVRIFATIDDVMGLLAKELSLSVPDVEQDVDFPVPEAQLPLGLDADVFTVPYGENGEPLPAGQPGRVLDLRENASLTITVGKNKGQQARVLGKNPDGHFRIGILHGDPVKAKWGEVRLLGRWWPAAAAAGSVPLLPVASAEVAAASGVAAAAAA